MQNKKKKDEMEPSDWPVLWVSRNDHERAAMNTWYQTPTCARYPYVSFFFFLAYRLFKKAVIVLRYFDKKRCNLSL